MSRILYRLKLAISCSLLLMLACLCNGADSAPVVIDYFFEAGCADCARVRNQILPELKERFEGFYQLNSYDVGIGTNFIRLATYQTRLKISANAPVMMVVDYQYVFNGFDAMEKGLRSTVNEAVTARLDPLWVPPAAIAVDVSNAGAACERISGFTTAAVAGAGFVDGINPCVISTLVFFMSLLGIARIQGRSLLLIGASFCLATFLTYTALGFGLLRALHLMTGFEWLKFGVEALMMAVLGVFAYLSFRDAWRFRISGRAVDVTLQLSDGIKARIHAVMRRGLGLGSLAAAGFVIGAGVTALESVCTGQLYVPTLVMIIKSSRLAEPVAAGLTSTAWQYLLLYNSMFVVPLVAVFVLTYFGLRTPTLLEWSRKNVVVSKVSLGVFFLVMEVLLAVM